MNDFLEQLAVIFDFNLMEIVGVSLLLVILIVQLYFYFAYYCKPFSRAKKAHREETESSDSSILNSYPRVSIIVEAENQYQNLTELLPLLLTQDYPDYEVVIVNNGSVDESEVLLENFKTQYPHLYWTHLPHSQDRDFEFRKLALTIGVKAAKGDVVLFTEAYCRPVSDQWIASMVRPMLADQKDIVLGYSHHREKGSFPKRMRSFDNLIFGMQYISAAIKGQPYTGVFRNLAFKKQLFYDNKGFSTHLRLDNCEEVFVNNVANRDNTTVCVDDNGFTHMLIGRASLWRRIKKSYSIARSCFKGNMANIFSVELFSRYLFYGLSATLIAQSIVDSNWGLLGVSGFMFLFRLIIQMIILNRSGGYFRSGEFYLTLPFFDILQPLYNLGFKTRPHNIIR